MYAPIPLKAQAWWGTKREDIPDGLHPRRHGTRRGPPSVLSLQTERAILALGVANLGTGPAGRSTGAAGARVPAPAR